MPGKLTKAQRQKLEQTPDAWVKQDAEWRAGRVFLALYDEGLVEMRLRPRSDVSCGPGYTGSDWEIRRTDAGRKALGGDHAG